MLLLLLLRNLFGGSSRQKTRIEFFAREKKSDQPQALAPLLTHMNRACYLFSRLFVQMQGILSFLFCLVPLPISEEVCEA